MPLGHHLGADQQIELAPLHGRHQLLVRPLATGSVPVHTADAGRGEEVLQALLEPFGPHPLRLDVAAEAGRAELGGGLLVVAVVAAQLTPPLVEGEGDFAVGAAEGGAAFGAQQVGGEAAAVEQQHRLLPCRQSLVEGGDQGRREGLAIGDGAQVDQLHRRQGARFGPGAELQVTGLAAAGPLEAGDGRGGAAQKDDGPRHLPPQQGQVAGVVTEPLSLLVARLVLLVQHDHAEILHRCEDRGARAHRDPPLSPTEQAPRVRTLPVGEARMEYRQAGVTAEAGAEAPHQLRSQGDFRHQHQGLAPPLQAGGDGPQVDLGLACAGDAVEQEGGEGCPLQGRQQLAEGGRLFRRRDHRPVGGGLQSEEGIPQPLGLPHLQGRELQQPRQRGMGGGESLPQLTQADLPPLPDILPDLQLPRPLGWSGRGSDSVELLPQDRGGLPPPGQTGGQSSADHLADGVLIIVGSPAEEGDQVGGKQRLGVEHLGHGLEPGRLSRRHLEQEADGTAPPQGNPQAHADHRPPLQLRGQQVGEGPVDGGGDGDQGDQRGGHGR